MGRWILCCFVIGLAIGLYTTDNQERKLLDALILVNEHDGLSDWGLEQMEELLDQAE